MPDDANEWERILSAEGLAPLDERIRGRVVVRPRVSPGLSERTNRRKEFGKSYEWRSETAELCWAFYSNGVERKDIAQILGRQSTWVKYTIRRVERARRRRTNRVPGESQSVELGAEVLRTFVEAAEPRAVRAYSVEAAEQFSASEPRAVRAYRQRTINLWRSMSDTVSDQEIAKMLAPDAPTLELVKQPESVGEPAAPAEKTQEQLEQEKFDAVVAGPFTPEALKTAAIDSFKYLLPVYLKGIRTQIKHAAARGAFVVPMNWEGPTNMIAGFERELKADGLAVERKGTMLHVTLVPNGELEIATGQI